MAVSGEQFLLVALIVLLVIVFLLLLYLTELIWLRRAFDIRTIFASLPSPLFLSVYRSLCLSLQGFPDIAFFDQPSLERSLRKKLSEVGPQRTCTSCIVMSQVRVCFSI